MSALSTEKQTRPLGTFSEQSSIPHFPVPDLESTIQTLIDSAAIFARSPEELAEFQRKAADALKSPAVRKRQAWLMRLQRHISTENWLHPIWMRLAYHGWTEYPIAGEPCGHSLIYMARKITAPSPLLSLRFLTLPPPV